MRWRPVPIRNLLAVLTTPRPSLLAYSISAGNLGQRVLRARPDFETGVMILSMRTNWTRTEILQMPIREFHRAVEQLRELSKRSE